MRVLITGAGGFVGSHLTQYLQANSSEIELHGTIRQQGPNDLEGKIQFHQIDLRNKETTFALIDTIRPDAIYHLAAQAFVPRSFADPWETLDNNIHSQLNILLACLESDIKPKTLVIGSAQVYGAVSPEEQPLSETAELRPPNPYSVSKIAQDMLGLQYHISHHLPIMIARPFNHFGPGQNEKLVAPDFAMQIARIEAGLQEPVMSIGNLEAKRDFTDVRDIVRAYKLILDKGTPGSIYNVGSGKAYSIQYLLDTLLSFTDMTIDIRTDPARFRPADIPIIEGDISLLHKETGWQPTISFEQSLRDVLEDCRQRVRNIKE